MNKSQMFKKAHAMARAVVESAKHERQHQINLYGYSTINIPSYKKAFSK